MNPSRPLPLSAKRPGSRWIVFFFAIFLLVGLGVGYAVKKPFLEWIQSGSWIQTPCTVLSSRVDSHRGKKGTTYSIAIRYRYLFNQQPFESTRYSFMGGSSSGYDSKAEVVKNFPPGANRFCFVDPENPPSAVLYRGWSWELLFFLFPLVFIAIGAGGIFSCLRPKPTEKFSLGGSSPTIANPEFSSGGPLVLKPKTSAFAKMCGAAFFALVWNGIISIFIYEVVESWRRGHPDWFLALFMIPFVVIGLGTIVATFYFMLCIGNPKAKLALNPATVALGETLRLGWGFDGKSDRIQTLSLLLEAREEASYRRGTRSYTDKNIFYRREIINLSDPRQIVQGLAEIEIPSDLVPTLSALNNKIVWTLTLHGRIHRWPDVKEEFEFTVLPARRPL